MVIIMLATEYMPSFQLSFLFHQIAFSELEMISKGNVLCDFS